MMKLLLAGLLLLASGAAAFADSRRLPVPGLTLYPGDAVEPQSLQYKTFNGPETIWRNYALDAGALDGKFVRRTLVAGRPIALADLKNQDIVRRGVMVRATFSNGSLEIATALMTLQAGAMGETIEARNMETGITVHATVAADGSLVIAAP